MNRSESRYFATAARMDEAFLTLLAKKDFEYITIKEICEVAGVNRSTFYLHYETMSDLLSESVGRMNEQFLASMEKDSDAFSTKLRNCPRDELYLITPDYLTPYLSYIKNNKRLFRTATENAAVLGMDKSYDRMFRHVFTPILDRYGVLLFAKRFTYNELVFTTENKYVCDNLSNLLTILYTPMIEKTSGLRVRNSKNPLITVKLPNEDDCNRIFESFGYSKKDVSLRLNRANISEEGQIPAFLRGAFLSCGSVTNPEKGYHLEFKVPFRNLANDLLTLLCEIEECNLTPKSVTRQGYFIVYFKDSEQIADFLAYIGAYSSSMNIINTKITKQVKNNAVRKVNSEIHNINNH